ncbi:MAG: T9SS type A sorting domain-containing protein [Prevotellaceae bacterium]|jgi:uncharacterized membrane protein|nr:T9SS type A sorting domain-containing protein [Prevotellaceae bacterium]
MKHLLSAIFFFFVSLTIQGQVTIIESNNDGIYPHSISSDGRYVVGQVGLGSSSAGHHTFVWNSRGLVEWDETFANMDGVGSTGFAISNTGRVAGAAPDATRMVDTHYIDSDDGSTIQLPIITAAFRDYTSPQQTWTFLPMINTMPLFYGFGSKVYGISDNGNIIVGGQTPGSQAQFYSAGYWDVNNPDAVVYHPLIAHGTVSVNNNSVASAVSGDGQVIGGQETSNGRPYTTLWINGVKTRIANVEGNPVAAISHNGKYAVFPNNLKAALYTITTNTLTKFDEGTKVSTPLAVSDNGIVVGYWGNNTLLVGERRKAFIYSRTTGIISLESFLESQNIAIQLDSLLVASGISADGRNITGFGLKNNKVVGFYAKIPEISGGLFPVQSVSANAPKYGTVELSWEAPETTEEPTLPTVAYHIYEGETPIDTVDASIFTRTFTGVADGTYQYTVKAVYDVGGEQEESVGKTVVLTMSRKTVLFYEPFDNYQTGGMQFDQTVQDEIPLSTGGWDVSAHTVPFSEAWQVNRSGRPPHSAGFVAPMSGEYSETLNSPFFDLREVDDLFLAFEFGGTGSSTPEKLAAEIYDGETWHVVATVSADTVPMGPFFSRYYEVSEYAGKDNVRFRFRCFGTGASGVNWIIDNVELTDGANRVSVQKPLTVSARQAENGKVHINWSDPFGTVSLRYMIEDDAFGTLGNDKYPYIAANMYPAEDLSDYDGYYLTSISFWQSKNEDLPSSAKPAQFRWFASQGGERLVSDTIVNPKLKWNTVQLAKPVRIDATKPLYYGVEVTDADPDEWPIGSGGYYKIVASPIGYVPAFLEKIDGRGNLYSENGGQTWRKVSEDGEDYLYELYCIRATLSKDSVPVSPELARRILGYRIYCNDTISLLKEEQGEDIAIILNNFTDENPPSGNVCYTVKTSFLDYGGIVYSEGVSDCITVVGIAPVQDENGWSIYPNPVKRNETVQVEIKEPRQTGHTIRLYDLSGKTVKEVYTTAQLTPVRLNVAPGIYILEITGGKRLKLIVQ